MYLRSQRLAAEKDIVKRQKELRREQLRSTHNPEYATLIGHLGRTFKKDQTVEDNPFIGTGKSSDGTIAIGINENDDVYRESRWCFDTPGVVQQDQVSVISFYFCLLNILFLDTASFDNRRVKTDTSKTNLEAKNFQLV